jgi:hypothetical protein
MSNETKQPLGFQFSLRSLLQLTLAAALFAFVAAPFLRTLSPEQWWRMAKALSASACGTLLWIAVAARLRYRNDRRSGRAIAQISSVRMPLGRSTSTILILLPIAMIVLGLYKAARFEPRVHNGVLSYASSLMHGLLLGMGLAYRRTHKSGNVAICENGITWGIWFAPWCKIHVLEWRSTSGELKLSFDGRVFSLTIEVADRSQVHELLANHLN